MIFQGNVFSVELQKDRHNADNNLVKVKVVAKNVKKRFNLGSLPSYAIEKLFKGEQKFTYCMYDHKFDQFNFLLVDNIDGCSADWCINNPAGDEFDDDDEFSGYIFFYFKRQTNPT